MVLTITGCVQKRFEQGYVFEKPQWNIPYDVSNETKISGTIVDQFQLVYDQKVPVKLMRCIANDGKKYLVQFGPAWYLDLQTFQVTSGDIVTIIGYSTGHKVEFRRIGSETIIVACPPEDADLMGDKVIDENLAMFLAREVRLQNAKISLRDKQGQPLWYEQGKVIGQAKNSEEKIRVQQRNQQQLQNELLKEQRTKATNFQNSYIKKRQQKEQSVFEKQMRQKMFKENFQKQQELFDKQKETLQQ